MIVFITKQKNCLFSESILIDDKKTCGNETRRLEYYNSSRPLEDRIGVQITVDTDSLRS